MKYCSGQQRKQNPLGVGLGRRHFQWPGKLYTLSLMCYQTRLMKHDWLHPDVCHVIWHLNSCCGDDVSVTETWASELYGPCVCSSLAYGVFSMCTLLQSPRTRPPSLTTSLDALKPEMPKIDEVSEPDKSTTTTTTTPITSSPTPIPSSTPSSSVVETSTASDVAPTASTVDSTESVLSTTEVSFGLHIMMHILFWMAKQNAVCIWLKRFFCLLGFLNFFLFFIYLVAYTQERSSVFNPERLTCLKYYLQYIQDLLLYADNDNRPL